MNRYVIPIGELFSVLDLEHIEYEVPATSPVNVWIKTESGKSPIRAFVKKNHTVKQFDFENGLSIKCSTEHLVFENGVKKTIDKCSSVDTITGPKQIIKSTDIGVRDVYDVAIDFPHRYVTPNGIIHHNTTLAKILINLLGVHDYDVMEINASRETSVDNMRDKITEFVNTMPFGKFKIVLLDEADYLSRHAQAMLRGILEDYADYARFILTCNYEHKILPAIHSRCQGFHMTKIDHTEFTTRVATILLEEGISFDLDVLDSYVKATYPDLRKCINLLQQNSTDSELISASSAESEVNDFRIRAVELLKAGRFQDARKLICNQIRSDEIEDFFVWMYSNLDLWGETDEQKDQAILIIRKGLVNHGLVADAEINLAATLIELSQI